MKVYRSESRRREGPIKVGVADYVVTSADTRITTTGLGSCLGVALADTSAGVAGLAHVMLPTAPESDDGNEAKFADTAIEGMLSRMLEAGADRNGVEAKIAGGSNMLDLSGVGKDIGTRNVEAAGAVLAEHGVPIVGEDTGGNHGRSLELRTESAVLVVRSAHAGVCRL